MTEDGCHILTFLETLFHFFAVIYLESAAKFLVADAQKFNRLEEVIAEPAVAILLDVNNLFMKYSKSAMQ